MEKIVSARVINQWLLVELDNGQQLLTALDGLASETDGAPVVDASGQGIYFSGRPVTLKKLKVKCGVSS